MIGRSRWLSSLVAGVFAVMLGTVFAQVLHRPRVPGTGLSPGLTYFVDGSNEPVGVSGELALELLSDGTWRMVIWESGAWTTVAANDASGATGTANRIPVFENDGSGIEDSNFGNVGPPAAGVSGTIAYLDGTFAAMDGSDSVSGLFLNFTNADHTGANNTLNALNIDGITGDAQAVEDAISIGSGWDNAIDFSPLATNARLKIANGGVLYVYNTGGNRIFAISNAPISGNSATAEAAWAGNNNNKGGAFGASGTPSAMDGSDTQAGLKIYPFTDAAHTGSGNIFAGLSAGTITTPDADAIHTGMYVQTGYDTLITGAVAGTAWAATDNPPAGFVGFYIKQGVAATSDCELVARLSNGTEVTVVQLVALAVCP